MTWVGSASAVAWEAARSPPLPVEDSEQWSHSERARPSCEGSEGDEPAVCEPADGDRVGSLGALPRPSFPLPPSLGLRPDSLKGLGCARSRRRSEPSAPSSGRPEVSFELRRLDPEPRRCSEGPGCDTVAGSPSAPTDVEVVEELLACASAV